MFRPKPQTNPPEIPNPKSGEARGTTHNLIHADAEEASDGVEHHEREGVEDEVPKVLSPRPVVGNLHRLKRV